MIDNRTNIIEGDISSMNDIDEIFREICSHHKKNLTTMRSFTKSSKGFNMRSIMLLCLELNCKLTIDPALDTFKIEYADADQPPIENPPIEGSKTAEDDQYKDTGNINISEEESKGMAVMDGSEEDPENEEEDEFKSVGNSGSEEPKEKDDAELF